MEKQFDTVKKVMDWVHENVRMKDDINPGVFELAGMVRRFVASVKVQEYLDMDECEMIELILEGLPALEDSDVEEFFALWYTDNDAPIDTINRAIEYDLRQFFHVTERR